MLRQYIITTRLVSVIQAIQLSRETGMLIAKRGEGNSAEEGRIVFANGRIIEVKVSHPNVLDAFNHISTWENCLVSFISQDSSKTTTSLLESITIASSPVEEQSVELLPAPLPRGARPIHESHQNQSVELSPAPLPRGARPIHESHQNQSHDTSVLNPSGPLSFTGQELVSYVPLLIYPLPDALRQIEQLGLSRAHRQLVLLIDGKRSVEDLTHAMGRTMINVQELLQDIARLKMV